MAITIEQFGTECHDILTTDSSIAGVEKVAQRLQDALKDETFVETHLGPNANAERNIIYEDSDLGFCVIAHVYKGAKSSNPHDHGPSWAIYGQAKGTTVMTDWKLLDAPSGGNPGRVEKVRDYELKPGMAQAYGVGVLHSPERAGETRLIRIEGKNMASVTRDKFVEAA